MQMNIPDTENAPASHNVFSFNRLRQNLTVALFFLVIPLLPFRYFPYGPFSCLSLYPLLLIGILNADLLFRLLWKNKLLFYVFLGIVAWAIWGVISLLLFSGTAISVGTHITLFISTGITLSAVYLFLSSYYLLPSGSAPTVLYRSITTSLLICAAYNILEFLHFNQCGFATAFLKKAIYFFSEVCINGSWSPPEIWPQPRLRSFFPEPGYYAMFLLFAALFYALNCVYSPVKNMLKHIVCNGVLFFLSILLLIGTKSTMGGLSLLAGVLCFSVLYALYWKRQNSTQRWHNGILCVILLLSTVLTLNFQRGGFFAANQAISIVKDAAEQEQEKEQEKESKEKKHPAPRAGGSIKTRMLHFYASCNLIAERPFFGCGTGNYIPEMHRALTELPEKTSEIQRWIKQKTPCGPSILAVLCVVYGIPGALLFFSFALVPLVFYVRKNACKTDYRTTLFAIPLLFAMGISMNGTGGMELAAYLLLIPPVLFLLESLQKQECTTCDAMTSGAENG